MKNSYSLVEIVEDLCTMLLYLSFIIFSTNAAGIFYMIGLVTATYLLHCMSNGLKLPFHKGIFQRYLFLIAIYCLLSSIWAQQSSYAIEKGVTLLELLVVFSILYEVYSGFPERLLQCIKWAGFILAIYTILFVGLDNLTDTIGEEGRLENSFANVNVIGMCCSTSILLAFFFRRMKKSLVDVILCVPALFVIAGSGSRKALVMLIIGLFYIVLIQHKANKQDSSIKKLLRVFGGLMVLFVLFYVMTKIGLFGGTLSRMDGLIASITGKGDADSSSILREYYRFLGFQQFLETPFLGMGMGNPRLLALQYTGNDCYLHCNYAEVAAGGGMIGLALVYWIYVKLWRTEYSVRHTDPYASIMLLLIFLNLILDYGQVSYYSKSNLFVLLTICIHYESVTKIARSKIN